MYNYMYTYILVFLSLQKLQCTRLDSVTNYILWSCCHTGRYTRFFSLFIPDIDECSEGTDNCSQLCNNTVGSYQCSCNTGFILDSDQHTCNGRPNTNLIHIRSIGIFCMYIRSLS